MPYYHCTFLDIEGRLHRRQINAFSRVELMETYANADEKLIACRRIIFKDFRFSLSFRQKVKQIEFLRFNQEMATLIRSGTPFIRALEIVTENLKPGHFLTILKKASTQIQSGVQISEAFLDSRLPFNKIYTASLLAGERSGHLEPILDKFNLYLQKMSNIRRKTISSMTYPAVLLGFMGVMFFIITMVIIPKFSEMYENFEAELPGITIFFLEASIFLRKNAFLYMGLVIAIYFLIRLIERMRPEIIIIDQIKLRLPFVGRIILESSLSVFSRTMAILIAGGIPVPDAVAIASETISNRFLSRFFAPISTQIREGNALSQVIKKIPQIPSILVEMIRVGEASGSLPRVLDESADFYETSIDMKINTLISLIEPVIIITLGVVIALMLLSIYLPIFTSIQAF